jgi:hypothetical protein
MVFKPTGWCCLLALTSADDFNKRDPKIQVRYLPLGTSASISQISMGSGDFGGGEIILTHKDGSR